MKKQYNDAQSKFFEAARDGKELDMSRHPAKEFLPKFRSYAEKHSGTPEAVPALVWMLENTPRAGGNEKATKWAIERLSKDHAADGAITDALQNMRYMAYSVDPDLLVAFYQRVIDTNKDKEAQAFATFNLAFTFYERSSQGGGILQALTGKGDSKKDKAKAEKLFRKVVKDYEDTKAAKLADRFIFEMDHLQIGMKAPDIVGKDVEGKEIKLSQFEGRVVVIDFWGYW